MQIAHAKAKIRRTTLAKLCPGFIEHIIRVNRVLASRSRLNGLTIDQNTSKIATLLWHPLQVVENSDLRSARGKMCVLRAMMPDQRIFECFNW